MSGIYISGLSLPKEGCHTVKILPSGVVTWLNGKPIATAFDDIIPVHKSDVRILSISNADKIRAMSDEELADFMLGVAQNGGVPTGGKIMRWIDWLRREADHDSD